MRRLLQLAGSLWAAPCSLLGLLCALPLLLCGGSLRRSRGELPTCLEIALPRRWQHHRLPFDALTLGQVIVGQNHAVLAALRAHEQVHVRQFQRWGVLLLLAYPAASLWQWLRGRRPYWDNPFEVQARHLSGIPPEPRQRASK
ncbi:hypothetical protein ACFOLG_15195 [Vogesella facilis]|uniref:Signal transducer regulating beta-lactamase production, contains metallopeptidase domain n=1 Tax=Vogesella facilis TaxID=1655232 RepID=A0ABV7RKX6_9NEIS